MITRNISSHVTRDGTLTGKGASETATRCLFRREGVAFVREQTKRNRAYHLTPRPTPRDNVTTEAFTDSEALRYLI